MQTGFVRKNFVLSDLSGIGSNVRIDSYRDAIDDEEYHPRRRKEYAFFNAERQAQRDMMANVQCDNVFIVREGSGSLPNIGGDSATWGPATPAIGSDSATWGPVMPKAPCCGKPPIVHYDDGRVRKDGCTYHESHDVHYHFHCCGECKKPTPDGPGGDVDASWGPVGIPHELMPCGGGGAYAPPAPALAIPDDDIHISMRDAVKIGGVYIVNRTGERLVSATLDNGKRSGKALLIDSIDARDSKARRLHMTPSIIDTPKLNISVECAPASASSVETGAFYGSLDLHAISQTIKTSSSKQVALPVRARVSHGIQLKCIVRRDDGMTKSHGTPVAIIEITATKA